MDVNEIYLKRFPKCVLIGGRLMYYNFQLTIKNKYNEYISTISTKMAITEKSDKISTKLCYRKI